jgi:hypothetical protein
VLPRFEMFAGIRTENMPEPSKSFKNAAFSAFTFDAGGATMCAG